MKNIISLIVLIVFLHMFSLSWARYGDEDSETTDDSYYVEEPSDYSTASERKTFQPKSKGSFLGWQENAGVRGQIYRFLKNPEGLQISLGMAQARYNNYFWGTNADNPYLTKDSADMLNNLIVADRMWGPKLGLQLGAAYLDLFVSPYWGNTNTLYIEAESGVWLARDLEDVSGISYQVGLNFYGAVLSFKNPIIDPLLVTSYTYEEAMQVNGGLGYVLVGLGAPAMIGLKVVNIPIGSLFTMPAFKIMFGLFVRAGVIFPNYVDFGWGLLGPDVKLTFLPHLSAYMHLRPYKTSYNTARIEFGLEYDF